MASSGKINCDCMPTSEKDYGDVKVPLPDERVRKRISSMQVVCTPTRTGDVLFCVKSPEVTFLFSQCGISAVKLV